MSNKELLDFLKANSAPAELVSFAEQLKTVDLDSVKEFIEHNEAGKKYVQALKDAAVTKGLETFKEKTLPGLVEEKIKVKFPEETEEQKRLRKLEDENKNFQNEVKREKLLNKALSYAQTKGYPIEFLDRFLGEDEDSTISNIDKFGEIFTSSVTKSVESKFKEGGRKDAPGGDDNNQPKSYKNFAEWKAANSN